MKALFDEVKKKTNPKVFDAKKGNMIKLWNQIHRIGETKTIQCIVFQSCVLILPPSFAESVLFLLFRFFFFSLSLPGWIHGIKTEQKRSRKTAAGKQYLCRSKTSLFATNASIFPVFFFSKVCVAFFYRHDQRIATPSDHHPMLIIIASVRNTLWIYVWIWRKGRKRPITHRQRS